MSYLVLTPTGEAWPEPPPGRLLRVVSERFAGHARERLIGCGPEGRITVARSDGARSELNRTFDTLARGDVFALDAAEPAGEGQGARIVAGTRVRIVSPAGRPLR